MNEHGPRTVAVLCVSHVDAEDLSDRIRHHLTTNGAIHGPALEGPGLSGLRAYQQGDQVLFHTRSGGRSSGIVNGTSGTVVASGPAELTVRLAGAADRTVHVDAEFVQGTQPDGSPNLSHAWARTIHGAQGGTLAGGLLAGHARAYQYRGYVGQSRSPAPHPQLEHHTRPGRRPQRCAR